MPTDTNRRDINVNASVSHFDRDSQFLGFGGSRSAGGNIIKAIGISDKKVYTVCLPFDFHHRTFVTANPWTGM